MSRRTGFRTRLTLALVGLVAATSLLLSVIAFVLVRRSLEGQLVADATAQVRFNIGVLTSSQQLPLGSDRDEFEASGLIERFALRGTDGLYADFAGADPYASETGLLDTPQVVGSDFLRILDSGDIAFEFVQVAGRRLLAVGGLRAEDGLRLVFFFDAAVLDGATIRLARLLAAGSVIVLIAGALTARRTARRVLRPIGQAGLAAQRIAAGDLAARLPVDSSDEFGRWAEAFNVMAAALEQEVAALEESRDLQRRFVADVSHELRTPLTGLVNAAGLLQGRLDGLLPTQRRAADILITDVGRLRRLVEDLLEISRLDVAAGEVGRVETDIGRFLDALIQQRLPSAQFRQRNLSQQVLCDPHGLERVIGNLLDNARTHAEGAGVVVEGSVDHQLLTVRVGDRGSAAAQLDQPDLDGLFQRFTTGDASRTGRSGSGLGLAIARGHARRMGGDLRVWPRPGGGLVFELRVPVTQPLPDGDGAANPGADSTGEAVPSTEEPP
ncbi:MAG: ATP-binding protein [Euzebya sp.]